MTSLTRKPAVLLSALIFATCGIVAAYDDKKGDVAAILEARLKLTQQGYEAAVETLPKSELSKAEWHRLNAQLWLAKAKAE